MLKNVNKFFPIATAIFVLIAIFLVSKGLHQVAIVLYFIFSSILYFIDERYIISFFVFNLPLLPVVLTDYKILSFVGPHEIIYGFSYFVLARFLKKEKGNKRLNKYQKLSISFVYFLFFFDLYPLVKDIQLGIHYDSTKGLFYIFKNFVRFYLYYMSLVFLIKIIYQKDLFRYIIVGVEFAIITIVISMIYTRDLILMDAGVSYDIGRKAIILSGEYQRYVGFYGAGGDENSVGIFMASTFGFFLALFEKNGNIKKYMVLLGFTVFGVLLTGSRTAFMALATVVLVFLITNKSGKNKFAILMAIVFFYFAFSKQLDAVLQRFLDPSAAKAVNPEDKHGRVGKWIIYLNWLASNPQTFMVGNLENINLRRAPHNYFILLAYKTGLIGLFVFLRLLIKLFKSVKFSLKSTTLKNAYYIIPFPFIIMTVNSFGSSKYLWIFIPLGAYFLSDKERKKINTKKNKQHVRHSR